MGSHVICNTHRVPHCCEITSWESAKEHAERTPCQAKDAETACPLKSEARVNTLDHLVRGASGRNNRKKTRTEETAGDGDCSLQIHRRVRHGGRLHRRARHLATHGSEIHGTLQKDHAKKNSPSIDHASPSDTPRKRPDISAVQVLAGLPLTASTTALSRMGRVVIAPTADCPRSTIKIIFRCFARGPYLLTLTLNLTLTQPPDLAATGTKLYKNMVVFENSNSGRKQPYFYKVWYR